MALRLSTLSGIPSNLTILTAGTSTYGLQYTSKCFVHHHMERDNIERYIGLRRSNPAKANRNTHINEKFATKLRGQRTVRVVLPTDGRHVKNESNSTAGKMRKEMLKRGINPYKDISPRNLQADQLEISSIPDILNSYIPPPSMYRESWWPFKPGYDSIKDSALHGLKSKGSELYSVVVNWYNKMKHGKKQLKKYLPDWTPERFAESANAIYESAHIALMNREKEKLYGLVTNHCFDKMWPDATKGSVVWKLHSFVEPSQVVNLLVMELPPDTNSGNYIAQITVRIVSKQCLAIYDRFGHLLLGDPDEPKDVEEYVVFENHVSSATGIWRMHGKIVPDWIAKNKQKTDPIRVDKLLEGVDLSKVKEPRKVTIAGKYSDYLSTSKKEVDRKYEEGNMSPEQMRDYEEKQKKPLNKLTKMFTKKGKSARDAVTEEGIGESIEESFLEHDKQKVSNPNDPKKSEPVKAQVGLDDEEEFEEFPIQDWSGKDATQDEEEDVNVWEDNWDDETVETDFSKQLAEELAKHGHKSTGTAV